MKRLNKLPFRRLLIILFPYSLLFFETRVYNTFTVTDVFLLVISLYCLCSRLRTDIHYSRSYLIWLIAFCVISLFGIINFQLPFFSLSVFINSYLRLLLYGFTLLAFPMLFRREDLPLLVKHLCISSLVFTLFGYLDLIGIALGTNWDFSISFVSLDQISIKTMRGLVSEKAHFCCYEALVLSTIIYYYKGHRMPMLPKFAFWSGVIVCALSASISGLIFVLTLLLYKVHNAGKIKSKQILIFPGVILLGIFFLYLNRERIVSIFLGEDLSSMHRVLGTWELAFSGLEQYGKWLTGIGIGQSGNYCLNFSPQLRFLIIFSDPTLSNVLSLILLQNGIIGLIIYLLWMYKLISSEAKFLLLILLEYFFATCAFDALLFSYLSVAYILVNSTRRNKKKTTACYVRAKN